MEEKNRKKNSLNHEGIHALEENSLERHLTVRFYHMSTEKGKSINVTIPGASKRASSTPRNILAIIISIFHKRLELLVQDQLQFN